MKKKLLHMIRHAKSDWSIAGQIDFDRKLNARGRGDAQVMAERLFVSFPAPKVFHVSNAQRTRETAEIFYKSHSDKIVAVGFHDLLYHASDETLMGFVRELPINETEVAIFTHNNGISEFVSRLSGQNIDMPTCAIATFEVKEVWAQAHPENCSLLHFDFPNNQ